MKLEDLDEKVRAEIEREVQRRTNKIVALIVVNILVSLGAAYAMVVLNLNVNVVAGTIILFMILMSWLAQRIKKGRL